MVSKVELQLRQESNEQLRLDCLAGFGVTLDHPICLEAVRLASELCVGGLDASRMGADLMDQLGRSLGSVAANFAEGHGRSTLQDKIRFLRMARGSVYESIVHARIYYTEDSNVIKEICTLAQKLDEYIISLTS